MPYTAPRPLAAIAFAIAFTLGCSPADGLAPHAALLDAPARSPLARTRHVVVVSIDGLRADAAFRFAPTLRDLMHRGAYSLAARTVSPTRTLPSHASMLTGVAPLVHGITWNDDRTDVTGPVAVPTVFGVADDAGLETAAFFSKDKFHHLVVPGTLDHVSLPARDSASWPAARTVEAAVEYLDEHEPHLTFVHIGEPDYAGHRHGWMSGSYEHAVRVADRAVARLIAAADSAFGPGEWTLLVTADHGGSGRSHGGDDAKDAVIPWIAWGDDVERVDLGSGIRTTDTAATVLWLLGVDVPATWSGRPVRAAFGPPDAETGG